MTQNQLGVIIGAIFIAAAGVIFVPRILDAQRSHHFHQIELDRRIEQARQDAELEAFFAPMFRNGDAIVECSKRGFERLRAGLPNDIDMDACVKQTLAEWDARDAANAAPSADPQ